MTGLVCSVELRRFRSFDRRHGCGCREPFYGHRMHGGRKARQHIAFEDLELRRIDKAPTIRRQPCSCFVQRLAHPEKPRQRIGFERNHGVWAGEAAEPSGAELALSLARCDASKWISTDKAQRCHILCGDDRCRISLLRSAARQAQVTGLESPPRSALVVCRARSLVPLGQWGDRCNGGLYRARHDWPGLVSSAHRCRAPHGRVSDR